MFDFQIVWFFQEAATTYAGQKPDLSAFSNYIVSSKRQK